MYLENNSWFLQKIFWQRSPNNHATDNSYNTYESIINELFQYIIAFLSFIAEHKPDTLPLAIFNHKNHKINTGLHIPSYVYV